MAGRTVFTVLEETARQYGDAPALHQPVRSKASLGYHSYSWNEWLSASREIALGLRALGLNKGKVVCILSETRAEFYFADLGIMGAGGIAAALYTAYPTPELVKHIRETESQFLFVEDAKTLAKLRNAAQERGEPLPRHVITMTGQDATALSFAGLRRLGRETLNRHALAFALIREEISPEDSAILYLTSGATGEPKMGLTSHAAILANIDLGPLVLPATPEDSVLAFLPSAHIAQRIVLELAPLRMGVPVWFSESLSRLPAELKSVRPTIFLAPPRVWEKIYTAIQGELNKRSSFFRKMFYAALSLGARGAELKRAGKPLPYWMSWSLKIADKFVFSRVRERLGGRVRIPASGAAPLSKELAEFFQAIGMPLVEGYGLTEAGVISFTPLSKPKPGSIGKLLQGVEARLTADGELQVRAPGMFQGYYHDQAATGSVLTEDGWFSTGDLAEVDKDGYWYITGRKKELIVCSNGKKIYPAHIENLLKMEPVINQAMLVGDQRPYVTALLTVNEDASDGKPVTELVQAAVSRVNAQLADFERIRRFKVLDRDFSIEHGELTPTMKIRRDRVLENYGSLIGELYLGRNGAK